MTPRPAFGVDQARRFYDRFGAWQDWQWWYEDPAIRRLLKLGDFGRAESVFELGCGTGRLAERLLAHHLPARAAYRGSDVSSTMVALARRRLARFGDRASVALTDGSFALPLDAGGCDRFVATYVLDLLPADGILAILSEAARVVRPGGRLCAVSITHGSTPLSRPVMRVWSRVRAARPSLVGGCRPIALSGLLAEPPWWLRHRRVVVAYGIASEVVIAVRRPWGP